MKNVFINCSPKEFYEVLKPLLLTLEGYTMESDEWLPNDRGCRIDYEGVCYPHYQKAYEDIDLADFIAAVKPKATVDVRNRFIPCTEEQHKEVYHLLRKLGYKQWDDEAHGWRDFCEGVTLGKDGEFFCYTRNGRPTLTIEELREIAKNVKP